MVSPYRIQPKNTNDRTKRLQILILTTIHIANMTSKDIKWPQMTSLSMKQIQNIKKNKNILKTGSIHKNIEIKEQYSDEFLVENDLSLELAMQITSNDKTVRNNTVQELKEFNFQSLATPEKENN